VGFQGQRGLGPVGGTSNLWDRVLFWGALRDAMGHLARDRPHHAQDGPDHEGDTQAMKDTGLRWIHVLTVIFALMGAALQAQERFWVQIEAQPTRIEAEERLRDYAARLSDVTGFSLSGGWYAIALGPYDAATAQARLESLRRDNRIPRDSYVARSTLYAQQIWPTDGLDLLRSAPPLALQTPPSEPSPDPLRNQSADQNAEQNGDRATPVPDETPRQARASEAALDRPAREALQIALRWAGYYDAAIDGAFGTGTRAAMSAWQADNGFAPTGVLTTGQRAALLGQYNAVLEGVGLERRRDTTTGIEMRLPLGLVAFEAYAAPFARYRAINGSGVQVVQISREGDRAALAGMFDLLQTLEIVPPDGPRSLRRDGFSITGTDANIVSQTEVVLEAGAIKGYILVWPRGDAARRSRVLQEMAESFEVFGGVLPPETGSDLTPAIDLVAGLQIRQPLRGRSGVYVSNQGAVLTAAEAVEGCGRITLGEQVSAQLVARAPGLDVALLTPETALSPPAVAQIARRAAALRSEVAVAGFSFERALGAPTLTFGTVADTSGLRGETNVSRLALTVLPGDFGGPVFDMTGAMTGVLRPYGLEGRQLPEDVAFATDVQPVAAWLASLGYAPRPADATSQETAQASPRVSPETLTRQARAMTVLVQCWE